MAARKDRPAHGLGKHPLYKVWSNVKDRCNNPNNPYFHNYGGRGIRIHEAWMASFPAFLRDVGERPTPQHTLDRKDNNGNYEPGNVTWATKREQANNQRKNVMLTVNGKTQSLAEWARETGLAPSTLHYRKMKGMNDNDVVLTQHRGGRKKAA